MASCLEGHNLRSEAYVGVVHRATPDRHLIYSKNQPSTSFDQILKDSQTNVPSDKCLIISTKEKHKCVYRYLVWVVAIMSHVL